MILVHSFQLAVKSFLVGIFLYPWLACYGFWQKGGLLEDKDFKQVYIHPFLKEMSPSFSLLENKRLSIDSQVEMLLKSNELDENIEYRSMGEAAAFNFTSTGEQRDYRFYVSGIRLCQFQLKAYKKTDSLPIILGKIPKLQVNDFDPASGWPDLDASFLNIIEHAKKRGLSSNGSRLLEHGKCFLVMDDELVSIWEILLDIGGVHYGAYGNVESVYLFYPRSFHVSGVASIFKNNPVDGVLTRFTLHNLAGDGSLTNDFFQTGYQQELDKERAHAPDHQFIFDPNDAKDFFIETSIFTNANRSLDWFRSIGYTDFGPKKITLHPSALVKDIESGQTTANNACYTPETTNTPPIIAIGNGDGIRLQNLGTDYDVVGHEFGHHVVFKTLKSRFGESLIIHEALADAFLFLRTDNPCLGEGICPDGPDSVCKSTPKCLRTADNSYNFSTDGENLKDPHLLGQILAAVIWDLKKYGDIEIDMLSRVLLKAVDFLLEDSGYKDFFLAFIAADYVLAEGSHCAAILKRSNDRGFLKHTKDLSCDNLGNLAQKAVNNSSKPSVPAASSPSSDKKKKYFICGKIDQGGELTSGAKYFVTLWLVLPIFIAWLLNRKIKI